MINNFDFLLANQVTRFEQEWDDYADPEDDNEFIEAYNDEGTNGWVRPEDENTTTAWAFNTCKINITEDDFYLFELNGDTEGSDGATSEFIGKVLFQFEDGSAGFHDLEMDSAQQGSFILDSTLNETAVYLIIASVPELFTNVEQTFSYEIQITKGVLVINQNNESDVTRTLINRYDILGREVNKEKLTKSMLQSRF